jgi:glycosyl transferase family 25
MSADALEFLNGWVDRAFVITLERARERQARLAEHLRGLRYELHLGSDKRVLDFEALERDGVVDQRRAREVSRLGRPMTPGEIGISLSHRRLWEEIVRNGWSRTLIFEDDAAPRRADLPLLPAALGQLPSDWDLVYLGWRNFEEVTAYHKVKQATYLALGALRLIKWTPSQVARLHPRPFSPNLKVAGLHHFFHAYALSQAGARKLLEAQTPVAHVADQLPVWLILRGQLNAFVTEPKFFDQDDQGAAVGGAPVSFNKE